VDVVELVLVHTVAWVATSTIATWYEVAWADAFQLRIGDVVPTLAPGGEAPPGERPVGVAGAFDTLTVKYSLVAFGLEPAEFEADTVQE
jgi:hypothetical protein